MGFFVFMKPEYIKTAKPTEYKGVTFRSKSEAMLAYCLDKFGLSYEYEPKIECDDLEWTPDFLISERRSGSICLLEYKPSDPTATYIKWIKSEWNKVKKLPLNKLSYSSDDGFVDCAFLVKHNFYNHDDARIITSNEWPEDLISHLIMDNFITKALYYFSEQALNYRFDLQHSNLSINFETKKDPLAKSDSQIQYEKREKLGIPEREFWLINLLIKYNNKIDWVIDVFESSWITYPVARAAMERIIQAHLEKTWQGGGALMNDVEDPDLEELIAMTLVDSREIPNIERQLPDVLTYLRNNWLNQKIREMCQQIDDPDCDSEQMIKLMQQKLDFEKERCKPIENPNMQS